MMCSCRPSAYEARHFLDAFKSSRAGCSSNEAPIICHGRAGTHNQGRNIMTLSFSFGLG
jgi:hypothetical protein